MRRPEQRLLKRLRQHYGDDLTWTTCSELTQHAKDAGANALPRPNT